MLEKKTPCKIVKSLTVKGPWRKLRWLQVFKNPPGGRALCCHFLTLQTGLVETCLLLSGFGGNENYDIIIFKRVCDVIKTRGKNNKRVCDVIKTGDKMQNHAVKLRSFVNLRPLKAEFEGFCFMTRWKVVQPSKERPS